MSGTFSGTFAAVAAVAIGLLIYLVAALLQPEKFS